MADFLQQLRLGGTTYDFYDSEFIIDNRNSGGAALTGVSKASELFDGMQITYWLNKAAGANATLNLTLSTNSATGAIPCYYNGTTRLSTHYPAGSIIHFTYRTNVTIGKTTISAGWWSDAVGSVSYASSAGGLSAEIANARLPLRLQASSMTGQTTVANVLQQGWHYINPSSGTDSSAPPFKQVDGQTGKDYRVMVTAYNDTWLQQIATDYRSNDVFIRRRQSGTWQPWTALVKMPQGATAAQLVPTTGSIAIFDSDRNATIKGATGASVDTNGNLTANNFIGSSLTASQAVSTDANKKLVSTNLTVSSATDEVTEATRFVHSVTEDAVGKITVKTRPMPSIPNLPSAPTTAGNYNLNVNNGTASWQEESYPTEVLTIVATPESGDIFSTTILYTDFLAAISAGKIIQISIPTYAMSGILNSKTGGYYTFNVYNADDNTVYSYVFSDNEDNNNLLQLILEDSQKSMPSGFQVAIPNAGKYVLSSTGTETAWVPYKLIMEGTPLGSLTEDYITTTTSWSEYQQAISNHNQLILEIAVASLSLELLPQEDDGSLVNTIVHAALGSDVSVSPFTFSASNNSGTVQFRYNNQILSYSDYSYSSRSAKYADYFGDSEGLSDGNYILNQSNGTSTWSSLPTIPAAPYVGTFNLTTSWSGTGPYTQTVSISGGTANSKIDLQPNSTVLTQMTTDGVTAMYVENNNGTFTVYTLGAAPSAALTIQYTRTEVTTS